MNTRSTIFAILLASAITLVLVGGGLAFWWKKPPTLSPTTDNRIKIPLNDIDDGSAHHYRVRAADGTMVTFFVVKSSDGVFRAAIDSCDVCYTSGKGYFQDNDFMVCENCGQRFASTRINVIKGGCNPAPLARRMIGDHLVITMSDVNRNSWYMNYRDQ